MLDLQALFSRAAQATPIAPARANTGPPRAPAISFGGGIPDPASFPLVDLQAAAAEVLSGEGIEALEYGGPYGYEGLRELIAAQARARGEDVQKDQVLITVGSSQALSLACFSLLNPGDAVVLEMPSFSGSIRAIRSYGVELVALPLDGQGIDLSTLEQHLHDLGRHSVRAKLLYTIANFHNPAGVTMTAARRHALVDLAQRWGFLVVEDDAYGDLRYEGAPEPSLLSLDRTGSVLKMGTFSKTLAPGLRLGWALGSRDLIANLASARHDMGVSPLLARLVARYMEDGRLDAHIQKVISVYRAKRDAMLASLDKHCSRFATWTRPQGGFFMWLTLKDGVDPDRLADAAANEGVGFVPGGAFFTDGAGRDYVRLAFSQASLQDIDVGIAAFGRALARAAD